MFVYVCGIWVHLCVSEDTYAYMYRGQKRMSMSCSVTLPYFLRQGLLLNVELEDQPVSKQSSCLCLP